MPPKTNQSRFSTFQIFIGAATLFLTVITSVGAVSYFVGEKLTSVVSSVDSLKGQLQETNLTLKELRNDSVSLKISTTKTQGRLDAVQKRVDKIQQKVSR